MEPTLSILEKNM